VRRFEWSAAVRLIGPGAYPFDQLALLLAAGLLIPVWALWVAIRADTLVPAGVAIAKGG
jgi:hypothetical protein